MKTALVHDWLNQMGGASAVAVLMMLVMLVFMILYLRRTARGEGNS